MNELIKALNLKTVKKMQSQRMIEQKRGFINIVKSITNPKRNQY